MSWSSKEVSWHWMRRQERRVRLGKDWVVTPKKTTRSMAVLPHDRGQVGTNEPGFVVYSASMSTAARKRWEEGRQGTIQEVGYNDGGYVEEYTPDHLNGTACWGPRYAAEVYKDLTEACAIALVVSEHEGVDGAIVLDAITLERVDSPTWAPHQPRSKSSSRRPKQPAPTRSASRTTRKRSRS